MSIANALLGLNLLMHVQFFLIIVIIIHLYIQYSVSKSKITVNL